MNIFSGSPFSDPPLGGGEQQFKPQQPQQSVLARDSDGSRHPPLVPQPAREESGSVGPRPEATIVKMSYGYLSSSIHNMIECAVIQYNIINYTNVYVCMCVCMYVYIYICIHTQAVYIYIYIYINRSLGVVSDKIASAKRNPVQTGNTTTTPQTTTTTTTTTNNNKG